MPAINLTQNLRDEYQGLFDQCQIKPEKLAEVENIISRITNDQSRYRNVETKLGIPWFFIAAIHNMESSLNFTRHLHNGDPLSSRTTHVPAGRPVSGNPPFTWEQSAEDSLKLQKLDRWNDWRLAGVLYKIEEYNGWGYRGRHPEVLSPYLWSGSGHYIKGKYIADGRWSDTAVSNQIGAGVILRRMSEKGMINFVDATIPKKPILYYSSKETEYGQELQIFLNKFPGIYLLTDGKPGQKTSDAFKIISGNYLYGDPRI
ncbi:MAG: hypothetical protein CVV24_13585 [Ignavibacteriae bacterium HGW-Ignavibacteriae-3]|nr:MAG: hypothetical protein CVV24_13585 [Ignavibacteriae bacterium HGW-Ignavibacteriae-3]